MKLFGYLKSTWVNSRRFLRKIGYSRVHPLVSSLILTLEFFICLILSILCVKLNFEGGLIFEILSNATFPILGVSFIHFVVTVSQAREIWKDRTIYAYPSPTFNDFGISFFYNGLFRICYMKTGNPKIYTAYVLSPFFFKAFTTLRINEDVWERRNAKELGPARELLTSDDKAIRKIAKKALGK